MGMKLGVDLDGVCYGFVDSLRHYLVTHHGYIDHELPDQEGWNFHEDQWGLTFDEFVKFCDEGVDAGVVFSHGEPLEGTREAFTAMREAGHTIHVVTDRRFGSKSAHNTVDWLNEWGLKYDSITFTPDKTILNVDYILDDRDKNYVEISAARNAIPVLLSRPWNVDLPNALRVDDWQGFLDIVESRGSWIK